MALTTAEMAKVLEKIATAPDDVRAIYNSVLLEISKRQDGLSQLFIALTQDMGEMKALLQSALTDDAASAAAPQPAPGAAPAPVEGEDDVEMMPMHNASRVVNTTQTPVKPPNVVSQAPNGAKS